MDLTTQRLRTLLLCLLLSAATLATFWPVTRCAFLNYDDNVFVSQNPHVAGGLTWANVAWAFRTGLGGNWQPITWLSYMLDVQLFGLKPGWFHFSNLLLHTANAVLLFLLLQRATQHATIPRSQGPQPAGGSGERTSNIQPPPPSTLDPQPSTNEWASFLVAALFALHPLHVESVAWVAERKDVLSGLFFMLTLWAYVRYVQKSEARIPKSERNPKTEIRNPANGKRGEAKGTSNIQHRTSNVEQGPSSTLHPPSSILYYTLALLLLALGLMSKPMLVTVPFVLLLLDYWPLRRFVRPSLKSKTQNQSLVHSAQPTADSPQRTDHGLRTTDDASRFTFHVPRFPSLLVEKLPFFALSTAACVVTFLSQRASESVYPVAVLPLGERVANALIACATYLQQTFWPVGLAVFYPLPNAQSWRAVIIAGVVVVGITAWAIAAFVAERRKAAWTQEATAIGSADLTTMPSRRPYLIVGWFWYLGMLVPVIGLVQVGLQARADRYTYLPLIGVFIVLVWGGAELLRCVVARVSAVLGVPRRAAERALQKDWGTPPYLGWYGVVGGVVAGLVLLACGVWTRDQLRHWQNSETLFRRAAAVTKDNWLAHYNLAETLSALGRPDEAVTEYERALAIHPAFARAQSNLGSLLLLQGQMDEAIAHLQKAVEIDPRLAGAHNNLGGALLRGGKVDEALGHLRSAVELDPRLASAHNSLGNILVAKGQDDEAIAHFQQALKLRPDFARAHCSLGAALLRKAQVSEARAHYDAALATQPANPLVLTAVAWALATSPQADFRNGPRAVELAQQAERSAGSPSPSVLGVLAAAYAESGRFPEAASAAQRALELATGQRSRGQAEALRSQLAAYQSGSPFRDPNLAPRAK